MQHWMKRFTWAGVLALGLSSGACASMKHESKIDDTRLAGLPPAAVQPVNDAKNAVVQAQQDVDAAKQAKSEADNRAKLVKGEVDVAQAQYDQQKTQLEIEAKKNNQKFDAEYAPQLQNAKLNVDTTKAKLEYANKLGDIAVTEVTLADRKVDLAKAKVDQARFQALNSANPEQVQAMKKNEAEFMAEVQKKQADVTKAEADLAKQRMDARDKYNTWVNMDRQLGTSSGIKQHRAEVPPPPQG